MHDHDFVVKKSNKIYSTLKFDHETYDYIPEKGRLDLNSKYFSFIQNTISLHTYEVYIVALARKCDITEYVPT